MYITITIQLNTRSDSLNEMRIATQEDDELALLKHTITHGWQAPSEKCQVRFKPIRPSEKS